MKLTDRLGIALICCGEDRAQCKSEPADLTLHLCSHPHMWSGTLGSHQKNEAVVKGVSFEGWLGDGGLGRSLDTQEGIIAELLLLHIEWSQLR